jgi:hypothetical protein
MPPFEFRTSEDAVLSPNTGKRGFPAFEGGPDAYGTKRARVGLTFLCPSMGIENMAPPHMQSQGGFLGCAQEWGTLQIHAHAAPHVQHAPHARHPQQRTVAEDHMCYMEHANMHSNDGMDMDAAELCAPGRWERFPRGSPTHYHKTTAIGYVPPMPSTSGGQEECTVRMWDQGCEFAGKSDFY